MSILKDPELMTAPARLLGRRHGIPPAKVHYARIIEKHLSGQETHGFLQSFFEGAASFEIGSPQRQAVCAFYLDQAGTEDQKALYYRKSIRTGIRTVYRGKVGYASDAAYAVIAGHPSGARRKAEGYIKLLAAFFGYLPEDPRADALGERVDAAFDGIREDPDFIAALNHFGFRLSKTPRMVRRKPARPPKGEDAYGMTAKQARKTLKKYKSDPSAWPPHDMHTVYRAQRVLNMARIKNV